MVLFLSKPRGGKNYGILSRIDFTDLKKNSEQKRFQVSQMAVNRSSLVDVAFSWDILFNFRHKSSAGFRFRFERFVEQVIEFMCLSWKKKAIVLFALWQDEKWLYHQQTNFLWMKWENYPRFQCTHMHWLLIAIFLRILYCVFFF